MKFCLSADVNRPGLTAMWMQQCPQINSGNTCNSTNNNNNNNKEEFQSAPSRLGSKRFTIALCTTGQQQRRQQYLWQMLQYLRMLRNVWLDVAVPMHGCCITCDQVLRYVWLDVEGSVSQYLWQMLRYLWQLLLCMWLDDATYVVDVIYVAECCHICGGCCYICGACWYVCSCMLRYLQRSVSTREREEEVGRQHQVMDRPGVRQVPEAVENRGNQKTLVLKSSAVPQRPSWLRDRW